MNSFRAILSGALVWLLIFITFGVLAYIPGIKDSMNQQALIVGILIIPYAMVGATFYYKNNKKDNGIILGLIMVFTALVLDALITVPFFSIPNGGSYSSFYSYIFLWVLVFINLTTVYFYWQFKIRHT